MHCIRCAVGNRRRALFYIRIRGKKKLFDIRIVRKQSINTSSLLRDMILGCFGMRYRALLTFVYGKKRKKFIIRV